jgi:hypothetical protein
MIYFFRNLFWNLFFWNKKKPNINLLLVDTQMATCCICLELLDSNKNLGITPCGHSFHLSCLLAASRPLSCPLCRRALENKNSKPTMVYNGMTLHEINDAFHMADLLSIIRRESNEANTRHPSDISNFMSSGRPWSGWAEFPESENASESEDTSESEDASEPDQPGIGWANFPDSEDEKSASKSDRPGIGWADFPDSDDEKSASKSDRPGIGWADFPDSDNEKSASESKVEKSETHANPLYFNWD